MLNCGTSHQGNCARCNPHPISGYQPYALLEGVRWSCAHSHYLWHPSLLTLLSVVWIGVSDRWKRKKRGRQNPRSCHRTLPAAVKPAEVRHHGWQSARARIAVLLLATAKRPQEEEPKGRLRQELSDALQDLPLRTRVMMLLRVPSHGVVVLALYMAPAAKHTSSGSATWGASELRKQLLHMINEMDKSEKVRMELV